MTARRLLVADPLPIFRAGTRALLSRTGGFEIVEASTLEEVGRAVRSHAPELALVDLALPPTGGIAAVEELAERARARVVVWSLEPTREQVLDAVRAGASGYLRKDVGSAALVRSLEALRNGEAALPRELTGLMVDALHGVGRRDRARRRAECLSRREREVLAFVAGGLRNREIARALSISEFTVKRHVQNILQKLRLESRAAAAAFYRTAFDQERAGAGAFEAA